jgi:hypothetical protein
VKRGTDTAKQGCSGRENGNEDFSEIKRKSRWRRRSLDGAEG